MRMAKPSENDIDAAGRLLQILDTIGSGGGGPWETAQGPYGLEEALNIDDELGLGTDFDCDDPNHLRGLYNSLAKLLREAGVFHRGALNTLAPVPLPVSEYDAGNGLKITAMSQRDGSTLWAVIMNGAFVLNTSGEWEDQPLPSSRSTEFLARTRFATPQAAYAALQAERGGGHRDGRQDDVDLQTTSLLQAPSTIEQTIADERDEIRLAVAKAIMAIPNHQLVSRDCIRFHVDAAIRARRTL